MATVHPFDATCPLCAPSERCECGRPVAGHPPLPAPGPLESWMAERETRRELSERSRLTIREAGGKFGKGRQAA